MAQKIRSDSGVELPPFNSLSSDDRRSSGVSIPTANAVDEGESDFDVSVLMNSSQEDVEDADDDDNMSNPSGVSVELERSRLETENAQLKNQLRKLTQKLQKYEPPSSPTGPSKATSRRGPGGSPFPVRTKLQKDKVAPHRQTRKQRRRWSLSSVSSSSSAHPTTHDKDLEIGLLLRRQQHLGDGLDDDAIVLFHDELDHNASVKGLHHRRTIVNANEKKYLPQPKLPSKPFIRPKPVVPRGRIPRNMSDNDLTDEEMLGDDEDDDDETGALLAIPPSSKQLNQSGNTRRNGGDNANNGSNENGDDDPFQTSFYEDMKDRATWLVGLMVLQSLSSFIIKWNEDLLEEHLIIVQFLTMLVGAGGNAGNQASVRVIRGLAIGAVTEQNVKGFLWNELLMGLLLAMILGVSGCLRAIVFSVPIPETMAITMSLWCIVFISIAIGSCLPVGMKLVGIDPAHSSTTIQVIMDILGVTITVHISKILLSTTYSLINGD
mmetsp:Transcript_14338/g.29726  ORF Transcript_14338/g.29726 Transcript_14338/m.29726 type:complete len:492 (-) Transcript_14338:287-1762(-)